MDLLYPSFEELKRKIKRKEIPILSKTTVYSMLKILVGSELLKIITIEDHETRYDRVVENRGHFKYDYCNTLRVMIKINISMVSVQDAFLI